MKLYINSVIKYQLFGLSITVLNVGFENIQDIWIVLRLFKVKTPLPRGLQLLLLNPPNFFLLCPSTLPCRCSPHWSLTNLLYRFLYQRKNSPSHRRTKREKSQINTRNLLKICDIICYACQKLPSNTTQK